MLSPMYLAATSNKPLSDSSHQPASHQESASHQASVQSQNQPPIRVVLAKLGLDGHDRGLKVVARMLRDASMEVIYLGLRQTTESVIAAVEQEDADVIGLSMHNAGHLALAPRILQALRDAGLDVPVVIGGIVPESDIATLTEMGISAVLHPGSSAVEVAEAVRGSLGEQPVGK